MDFFSLFWVLLSLLCFVVKIPYCFSLLIISSIFQGVSLNIASFSLPLFNYLEIITIIRFSIPPKLGVLKVDPLRLLATLSLISIVALHSYLASVFFSGMKVYTPSISFENNFYTNGVALHWSMSNINQIILFALNVLTMFVIYQRRIELSIITSINQIKFTSVIFIVYSFTWLFYRPLAALAESFIYTTNHTATAIFENRLSGTFIEPSFAGLFIASLAIPFLSYKGIINKLIGVAFIFLLLKNGSTTAFFTFFISLFFYLVILSNVSNKYKLFMLFFLPVLIIGLSPFVIELLQKYTSEKATSTSGMVRQASNLSGLDNLYDTYGIGIGAGSARISSLGIGMLANFGVFGFLTILLYVVWLIRDSLKFTSDLRQNKYVLTMLLTCFFGSWAANPDYSFSFLWVLIFCSLPLSTSQAVGEVKS